MINFNPLGVVGRGSETQFQVGKNFDNLAPKGLVLHAKKEIFTFPVQETVIISNTTKGD